jgi:hypothetical protein
MCRSCRAYCRGRCWLFCQSVFLFGATNGGATPRALLGMGGSTGLGFPAHAYARTGRIITTPAKSPGADLKAQP